MMLRKSEGGSLTAGGLKAPRSSGVSGVKILCSRHFLALNMMTKNLTFSFKNQAFKK